MFITRLTDASKKYTYKVRYSEQVEMDSNHERVSIKRSLEQNIHVQRHKRNQVMRLLLFYLKQKV